MSRHDHKQQKPVEQQQRLLDRLGYRTIEDALRALEGDRPPSLTRNDGTRARPPPDRNAKQLLRANEVADMLGSSIWTVYRLVKRGTFPKPIYLTGNGPALWRARDVDNFIKKRQTARRVPLKRGCLKNN